MAHWMRATYQRRQATPRSQPLPLQGLAGMARWVGLAVIADHLINVGRALAKQSVP
jgi:hypothetical protein